MANGLLTTRALAMAGLSPQQSPSVISQLLPTVQPVQPVQPVQSVQPVQPDIDIAGLFAGSGMSPLERQALMQREGEALAANVGRLGSAAAYYAPQRAVAMQRGVARAAGRDTRAPEAIAAEEIGKLDTNTEAGQQQAVRILSAVNPQAGLALKQRFESRAATMQQEAARREGFSTYLENSSLPQEQKTQIQNLVTSDVLSTEKGLELISTASSANVTQAQNQRQIEANLEFSRNTYDAAIAEKMEPLLKAGVSVKDAYDVTIQGENQEERLASQLRAINPDLSLEEATRTAAAALREPEETRYEKVGDTIVALRGGQLISSVDVKEGATMQDGVALLTKLGDMDDNIGFVQSLRTEANSFVTGVGNTLLSGLPATQARAYQAKVDTLKNRLTVEAINSLREAAAASGSSGTGLGQITEKELAILEGLVATLDTGMGKEDFVSALQEIETHFNNTRDLILGRVPASMDFSSYSDVELSSFGVVRGDNGALYMATDDSYVLIQEPQQ